MKVILVAVLLCIAAVVLSSPVDEAKKYNASAYKRDMLNPPRGSLGFITTPGGNVSYFNSTTNPVIAGHGVGLSLSVLEACGIILPHLHPRAAKIMYSIDGENILVGFIQENGAPTVFNTLKKGQAAFVPRGAIMFFQNLGCKPVTQVFSYNHEDPGLLSLAPNIWRMPDDVIRTGFGITQQQVDRLGDYIPGYPLDKNADCRRRCGLSP